MPTDAAERLAALLDHLVDTAPDQAHAVGVENVDDHDATIVVRTLSSDPVADLVGFTAPPTWQAAGLVAPGAAHDPRHPATPTRCVVGCLATRTGPLLTRLAHPGGTRRCGVDPVGRIPDLCRRMMGAPTPPPVGDTESIWFRLWLDDVLTTVLDAALDGPTPTWSDLAGLHPAVDRSRPPASPRVLAHLARAHAHAQPWSAVRLRCVRGLLPRAGVTPVAAQWMDDGMFSRWLAGLLPPRDEVIGDLGVLLPAPIAATLRALAPDDESHAW